MTSIISQDLNLANNTQSPLSNKKYDHSESFNIKNKPSSNDS